MKRWQVILMVMLIAFPVILGAFLGTTYFGTDAEEVPTPTLEILGKKAKPNGYEWRTPILGGLIYKRLHKKPTQETNFGELSETKIEIDGLDGYVALASLKHDGKEVWQDELSKINNYNFNKNGNYVLDIICSKEQTVGQHYGELFFAVGFSVNIEPKVVASSDLVRQGDILAIRVYSLVNEAEPLGESDLGPIIFTTDHDRGISTGYVAVDYNQVPSNYNIKIDVGDYSWSSVFKVLEVSYAEQTERVVLPWGRNAQQEEDAKEQYEKEVKTKYTTFDKTRYWTSPFIMPLQGTPIADYGVHRFFNRDKLSRRSTGLVIGAAEGTEIVSPNAGRVVLAKDIEYTGKTLIIEHGGGLKSYFFHLKEIAVNEGAFVKTEDLIGWVGATGDTMVPILHYELRLMGFPVNPSLLIANNSGLLYFEAEDKKSGETQKRQNQVAEIGKDNDGL